MTEDPDAFSSPAASFDYDGETVDRRLTRRKQNGIGTVTMPACG